MSYQKFDARFNFSLNLNLSPQLKRYFRAEFLSENNMKMLGRDCRNGPRTPLNARKLPETPICVMRDRICAWLLTRGMKTYCQK